MTDDKQERPSVDKPLNGPKRPALTPILAIVGVIVVVVVLYLVISALRYNT